VRAGLSTRRWSCKWLVSVGAGLPTQRVSGCFLVLKGCHGYSSGVRGDLSFELLEFRGHHRFKMGLHRRHLGTDLSSELVLFGRCHRSEEELYLLHLCFGRSCCCHTQTVFRVMSFLLASVTRPSCVNSILPLRGVGRLCGVPSIHCSISYRWGPRQRLTEPG